MTAGRINQVYTQPQIRPYSDQMQQAALAKQTIMGCTANYTVPGTTHSNEHQFFHCPANSTTLRLLNETNTKFIHKPFKHKCSSTRSQDSFAIEQSIAPQFFIR